LTTDHWLPTVGILYAGEMGAALGGALIGAGLRVLTTLEGRSAHTERRCREAELECLPSLREVVRSAELVVSVVPPSAAVGVAKEYADLAHLAPAGRLYVDANAVSPARAVEIDQVLAGPGVDYVDVAINGLAAALHTGAIVYLSGGRAAEVAVLLGRSLRVQVVGDTPGKASALKGALAGLSKGLTALFVEIAIMAREAGLSEFFLERARVFYPGVMEVVERMLPTYPRHGGRRAEEMGELVDTMHTLGLQANMVNAARQVTQAMADAGLEQPQGRPPWTAGRVLEALYANEALHLKRSDELHERNPKRPRNGDSITW
jgi:3-hydroxyisobutyrate dehydrogenase-like beta-hydroxyacid dehydrogenase